MITISLVSTDLLTGRLGTSITVELDKALSWRKKRTHAVDHLGRLRQVQIRGDKTGGTKTSGTSTLTVFYTCVKQKPRGYRGVTGGDYEGFKKLCFAVFGCD